MSAQHTPGPWQVVPGVGDCLEIIHVREDGGFVTIATLHPDVSQPGNKGGFASKEERVATCVANARVIASVPEFLSVITGCLEHMEHSTEQGARAYRAASAAIAKEKGEAP